MFRFTFKIVDSDSHAESMKLDRYAETYGDLSEEAAIGLNCVMLLTDVSVWQNHDLYLISIKYIYLYIELISDLAYPVSMVEYIYSS